MMRVILIVRTQKSTTKGPFFSILQSSSICFDSCFCSSISASFSSLVRLSDVISLAFDCDWASPLAIAVPWEGCCCCCCSGFSVFTDFFNASSDNDAFGLKNEDISIKLLKIVNY